MNDRVESKIAEQSPAQERLLTVHSRHSQDFSGGLSSSNYGRSRLAIEFRLSAKKSYSPNVCERQVDALSGHYSTAL
jgi:hypothetical protein